jgi:hypothetical protein
MAFDQLEPFGYATEALRAGQICAVIANVNRPKGARVFKATDFVQIDQGRTATTQRESAKSMWLKAWAITELYKGTLIDGNGRQSTH